MAVLIEKRGSIFSEPRFLDAPDEDAVGSEMRHQLLRAKQIGLGVDEIG